MYYGLIARGTKDYLDLKRTIQYLNMPEALCVRICKQINANNDERIDHNEFIEFFGNCFVGNLQSKLQIAFKCYDLDDNQCLTTEDVKFILRHVPVYHEDRYGISFGFHD